MPHYLHSDLQFIVRLLVAMVLGGALGWERESQGKSAGIRTLMLMSMGCALFMIVAELAVASMVQYGASLRFDPIRVLEAVLAGIGFLTGGVVFVSRGDDVRGLTTAASIWTTCGIGLLAGLRRYFLATAVTVLVLVILRVLQVVEVRLKLKQEKSQKRPRAA